MRFQTQIDGSIEILFLKRCKSAITENVGTKKRKEVERKVKRRMIKRISEYARPKIWCPQEDYHLPKDGISMSTASAFPSSINEKSEIAIYRNTGVKHEDGGIFVLQSSKTIAINVIHHRYIN